MTTPPEAAGPAAGPAPAPAEAPDRNAAPADAHGWDAALMRAEHAADRPVPTPGAPSGDYAPPAAALEAEPIAEGRARRRRTGRGYRFSDLIWGAFFVPAVLMGLVAFLYFLVLPPISWMTGLAAWQVRELTYASMLGTGLWLTSLTLLFPPVWYAWRRGRRSWIWPVLAAPVVTAILVFISTLIVLRSPTHPDFAAAATDWAGLWGPVTAGAAGSIAFGSRLRGLSRRIFRRIARWWDQLAGIERPR